MEEDFGNVSENKGLANQGIYANLPIDSRSFPFQVNFKTGRYDLGIGYETTWSTRFTLPTEPTGDIQPDTITFNMGIYIGIYYPSGDLIVWPISFNEIIVTEKFDKPGGEDIGYHKTGSTNKDNKSSDSRLGTTLSDPSHEIPIPSSGEVTCYPG